MNVYFVLTFVFWPKRLTSDGVYFVQCMPQMYYGKLQIQLSKAYYAERLSSVI